MNGRELTDTTLPRHRRWIAFLQRLTRNVFWSVVCALVTLGGFIGYRLSSRPGLRTYKLLNAVGLILTLMGALVLSEILASKRWKSICVNRIAPTTYWVLMTLPLGAFLGSSLAFHKPSGTAVSLFSVSFLAYSMVALVPFVEIVVDPRLAPIKKDVDTRWRWMGFWLVLTGIMAQLTAAIMDLNS